MGTTTTTDGRGRVIALPVLLMMLAAGCASRPAPEYGGHWKPVNRYAETPQAIPLQQSYTFHPSPMDGTLKAMLERWARDSKRSVSYGHPSDFTLHSAVAKIRTDDLQEAVSQLSEAYAPQGIVVMVDGNRILVRETTRSSVGIPAPAAGTP